MTRTLTLYVARLFLGRAALTVGGLSALVLLFDVLANADRVTGGGSGIFVPLILYAALRLPDVVSLIIPLAALLAAIITFGQLVSNHEMHALRASGVSLYRVALAILAGAAIVAAVHLVFAEVLRPATANRLHVWQSAQFSGLPPIETPREAPTWFAVDDAVAHVRASSLDGRTLDGVTVVHRDAEGRIVDLLQAEIARYVDGGWILENGTRTVADDGSRQDFRRLEIELAVTPASFSVLAADPDRIGIGQLWRLGRDSDRAGHPSHVYEFWVQRKLARPFGVLALVLLAAPMGMLVSRGAPFMLTALAIIGAGFLYFIAEQLLATLGEGGTLPTMLAAWAPATLFTLVGATALLHMEH